MERHTEVWDHFTKEVQTNGAVCYVCKHCKKIFSPNNVGTKRHHLINSCLGTPSELKEALLSRRPLNRLNSRKSKRECDIDHQKSLPETSGLKKSRPPTFQRSVKKSHLLAAIEAVKNLGPKEEEETPRTSSQHYVFPQKYPQSGRYVPMRQTPKANLLLVLRNSISHHDWCTAALVLKFMCESTYEFQLFIGPFFQVLMNHSKSTDESVRQFLSEAFGLRTNEQQQTFFEHLFHLPQDLGIYKEPIDPHGDDSDDGEW